MKSLIFLLILPMFIPLSGAFSQDTEIDSVLDLVLFGDTELLSLLASAENFQFIYARTNYENKTYFAGRNIGTDQPNLSTQLFYFHSIGIHAGIGGVWYSGFEPKLYTTLLSAGYSGKMSKSGDYRYRVSFDKYFFSKNDSVPHVFNSSLNTGATIDKGFAGSRIDLSLLMGKETGMQISWDFYGDLKLIPLGNKGKIKFEPEISFYLGTEEVVFFEIGRGAGGLPRGWQIINKTKDQFGLLNTEIMFPVTVDYQNFDFELGYTINLPKTFQPDTKLPVTSYFNFSIGYIFSLN